jgi:hypothetical protein
VSLAQAIARRRSLADAAARDAELARLRAAQDALVPSTSEDAHELVASYARPAPPESPPPLSLVVHQDEAQGVSHGRLLLPDGVTQVEILAARKSFAERYRLSIDAVPGHIGVELARARRRMFPCVVRFGGERFDLRNCDHEADLARELRYDAADRQRETEGALRRVRRADGLGLAVADVARDAKVGPVDLLRAEAGEQSLDWLPVDRALWAALERRVKREVVAGRDWRDLRLAGWTYDQVQTAAEAP